MGALPSGIQRVSATCYLLTSAPSLPTSGSLRGPGVRLVAPSPVVPRVSPSLTCAGERKGGGREGRAQLAPLLLRAGRGRGCGPGGGEACRHRRRHTTAGLPATLGTSPSQQPLPGPRPRCQPALAAHQGQRFWWQEMGHVPGKCCSQSCHVSTGFSPISTLYAENCSRKDRALGQRLLGSKWQKAPELVLT